MQNGIGRVGGDQCIAYASDLAGMQLSVILIFHTSLMMLAGIPQKKTVCMLGLFLLPKQVQNS